MGSELPVDNRASSPTVPRGEKTEFLWSQKWTLKKKKKKTQYSSGTRSLKKEFSQTAQRRRLARLAASFCM